MSLFGLCKQSADVQRATETNQASGGITNTWTTVLTGLVCSVQVNLDRGIVDIPEAFSQRQLRVPFRIYFPQAIELQVNDRAFVDGVDYYLINRAGDMGGRGLYTVAYCIKVDQ